MAWILLGLAGLLEIVWATAMKYSHGFTRLAPTLLTFAAAASSFWLLALAMRTLPLGTAYPIWTGIGTAGAFIAGAVMMGDALSLGRIISVLLIVVGIVGLKLS